MANALFNALGGNNFGVVGSLAQLSQQFEQFKASYKGSARDEVQRMLNSGEMSQEQYNHLQSIANQLINFRR